MLEIRIRPRVLKDRILLACFGLGATLAIAAGLAVPEAHADGNIDATEDRYISRSHGAVCGTLDIYPTKAGVLGVMSAIVDDGFAPDSAVDIINASVNIYCHDHWALLVAIGDQARNANGAKGFVA